VQNHKVPTENYWTIHENFKIVIQQWVLCVMQYGWYRLFNNSMMSLMGLAVIFTTIFNISLYRYTRLFSDRLELILPAMVLANLSVSGYMSARPNIITASTLLIELTLLHKFFIKQEVSTKRFLIEMIVLSIWQINFQSAGWYFLIVMIMPYLVPPIWRKGWYKSENQPEFSYRRRAGYCVAAIWLIVFSGLINPNGINGLKYLLNSSELSSTGSVISEMNAPKVISTAGVLAIVELLLLMYNNMSPKKKNISPETTWLVLGTSLLSATMLRNGYMLIYGIVPLTISTLYAEGKKSLEETCLTSKRNYIILIIMYLVCDLTVLIVGINFWLTPNEKKDDMLDYWLHEQVQYLSINESNTNKEDLVIYTAFESGQYYQFYGYKTYMDARPELYMKSINGQEDIWEEWYNLCYGDNNTDSEVQEFLDKYNFDYLCTGRVGYLGSYLRESDDYEEVVYGRNYSLFKNISKQ
jgi:hypothetical protein